MTIHYHGTPITPRSVLQCLSGRNFCVSYARPDDVKVVHKIGQSVMLDNGAFSFWKTGRQTDWEGYYEFCHKWLAYRSTWAVIPDVIDGSEEENDSLLGDWSHPAEQSAPVWHLHESFSRLRRLASEWPRICFGSSGRYSVVGSPKWHQRTSQAFDQIVDSRGAPVCAVHMLRGMSLSGSAYPFASVDSTDIARNHNRGIRSAQDMAEYWDGKQCPAIWNGAHSQLGLFEEAQTCE